MLTGAISGLPYSYTMHGPDLFFEPVKWRIDEKTARARFVVCISHFCRSQAMLFSDPVHWPKLRIVHCGVSPARYGQAPRPAFGKRVLFIGRLDAVKGGPLLLEAFAAARAGHPEAHLTVVGDGPARGALEAQAAALGLAGAVTFAGYRSQDEVAALLEEADKLVLPSFAEGVPMVLMEAMASRIPVVASRVAGVPELVRTGDGLPRAAGRRGEPGRADGGALEDPRGPARWARAAATWSRARSTWSARRAGFCSCSAAPIRRPSAAGRTEMPPAISVVIAARNEEALIRRCLGALVAQETERGVEVVVAANACTDRTVEVARAETARFAARAGGWSCSTWPKAARPAR